MDIIMSEKIDLTYDVNDAIKSEPPMKQVELLQREIHKLSNEYESIRHKMTLPIVCVSSCDNQAMLTKIERRLKQLEGLRSNVMSTIDNPICVPEFLLSRDAQENLGEMTTLKKYKPGALENFAAFFDETKTLGLPEKDTDDETVAPQPKPERKLKIKKQPGRHPSAAAQKKCSDLAAQHDKSGSKKQCKHFTWEWQERAKAKAISVSDLPENKQKNRTIRAQCKPMQRKILEVIASSIPKEPISPTTNVITVETTGTSTITALPDDIKAQEPARKKQKITENRSVGTAFENASNTICKNCGTASMEVDEKHGNMVCGNCGIVAAGHLNVSITGEPSHVKKNTSEKPKNSGYKPLGHMAEVIAQFQGKRGTSVPDEIVELIRKEMVKYRVKPVDIDVNMVRKSLKKFEKGNQYYKYCAEIAFKLSGIPPPHLNDMQEEFIINVLFPLVVMAYRTSPRYLLRQNNRVGRIKPLPNNMNYNYVFYKLCQLCGFNQFLRYIKLPKGQENTRDNDENGWKHICQVNRWKYYPTV